jgi:hypothetical protein
MATIRLSSGAVKTRLASPPLVTAQTASLAATNNREGAPRVAKRSATDAGVAKTGVATGTTGDAAAGVSVAGRVGAGSLAN